MKSALKLFLAVLLHLVVFSAQAQAGAIHLSVAASMTDAFKEIIAEYSASHPQVTIRPNFASSGSLAKQIDQGAPADIYVSANPKWMQYLVEEGLIAAGSDRVFAHNSLVFISMNPKAGLEMASLTNLERIALGTPQNVPAGQYARQAMVNAGVYRQLQQQRKLIMAKDVRQALLYADRGEVDGAFVYKTDALLAGSAKIAFVVPDELYDRVTYPLGLTVRGAKKKEARAFYDYMGSSEARGILKKYQFVPVP